MTHSALTTPIYDFEQAKSFISYLIEVDRLFHFDDDLSGIIWGSNPPSPAEMKLMDARRNELFDPNIQWGEHGCPFGLALHLSGHCDD